MRNLDIGQNPNNDEILELKKQIERINRPWWNKIFG